MTRITINHYFNKQTMLLSLTLFLSTFLFGQCPSASVSDGSCPGGCTSLSNNVNINSGQTICHKASSGSFGNINLSGGTLLICGTATIYSMNMSGGKIIINSGATLTLYINGSRNINGNVEIINYGTFNSGAHILQVQNPGNVVHNYGTFNVGSQFILNNTSNIFINHTGGVANIGYLRIFNGSLCLEDQSEISLTNFENSTNTVPVSVSGGQACINYTGNAKLNAKVTNSNSLLICEKQGATQSGSSSWGSSNVISNCTQCGAVVLPIELAYFKAKGNENNEIDFEWKTYSETNNDFFTIEYSYDMNTFFSLVDVSGAGNHRGDKIYAYASGELDPERVVYFRLKQTDYSGIFTYSPIVTYSPREQDNSLFTIHPVPVSNDLEVVSKTMLDESEKIEYQIIDWYGRKVDLGDLKDNSISVDHLESGSYILKLYFKDRVYIEDFIKK